MKAGIFQDILFFVLNTEGWTFSFFCIYIYVRHQKFKCLKIGRISLLR